MHSEENGKHVGSESGIDHELSDHLGLNIVAHKEHRYELKRQKDNDTREVQLRKNRILEVRAATAKQIDTASNGIAPQMPE
jgi:hypothetical protein